MSIYKKIQLVKQKLLEANLRKTGENKYAGLFEMISDSPSEGFHSAISDLRDSEPLHLIEGLVMFTQRQLKRQLDALPKSQIHCQACINTIKYRKHRAKQLVCRQELDKFFVTETFVGEVTGEYRVSRCNGVLKCKCRGYERLGIPCRHMYSVLRHFSREQIPEVHAMHTVATIRQAIIDAHVTLNIGDLEESQNIESSHIAQALQYRNFVENSLQ